MNFINYLYMEGEFYGDGYAKITYISSKNTNNEYTVKPNYGTETKTLYEKLYASTAPTSAVKGHNKYDVSYNGNYANGYGLQRIFRGGEVINIPSGTTINTLYTTNIKAGNNTVSFARNTNLNRWIFIQIGGGYGTGTPISISNFKLIFADGTTCTLQQAVNNNYIEPLTIIAAHTTAGSTQYLWKNFFNMYTGGATDAIAYPQGSIMFKVKDKSALSSVSLTSNVNFDTRADGIIVIEAKEGIEISTEPFY